MTQDKLSLRHVALSEMPRWEANPKPHDIGLLIESFKRYGFKDPMKFEPLLNGSGGIVEGNGRSEALMSMRDSGDDPPRGIARRKDGEWLVPVLFGVDASEATEAQSYALDHNALTVLGGDFGENWATLLYDSDGLLEALVPLAEADALPLSIDGDDLDAMLRPAVVESPPAPEPSKKLLKKWGVELGQLWAIGEHRLFCGDATDGGIAASGGDQARLVITDPPYGVEYDAAWRQDDGLTGGGRMGKVRGDDTADWSAVWGKLRAEVLYAWHASWYIGEVESHIKAAGYEARNLIVWVKPRFAISRGHYHWRHEPCWYAVRKGAAAGWIGDRKQTTVWEIPLDQNVEGGHSTQKPAECMARPMRNHEGDVCDPFLGSGTTMVAAEALGRICYGVEIEPQYVAVTLERMTGLGVTPELVDG